MKRFLSLLLCMAMLAALLSGCGEPQQPSTESTAETQAETTKSEGPTEPAEPTLPAYDYTPHSDLGTVENPYTEWPDYTLPEGATVDEMRAMAVKVMRDELTIAWTPNESFAYYKTVGLTRTYEFTRKVPYAGLPYTTAGGSIFSWLEHYDMTNGVIFNLPEDVDNLLGNSCAASCSWGIAAVAPSIMSISTFEFVPAKGMYPVGGLTIPENVSSLKDYMTSQIIADNGTEKVLQAYLQILPADVLIASQNADTDHAVMATDVPHVEYLSDGSIDLEKSYVLIQDQRAKEVFTEVDGYTRSIRGRLDYQVSFQELLESAFIPFAPKEFMENGLYEKANVRLNKEVTDLDTLLKATVLSNYRVASIHARVYNEDGGLVYDNADIMRGSAGRDAQKLGYKVSGILAKNKLKSALISGKTYTVSIEVRIATGELIKLGNIKYTAE